MGLSWLRSDFSALAILAVKPLRSFLHCGEFLGMSKFSDYAGKCQVPANVKITINGNPWPACPLNCCVRADVDNLGNDLPFDFCLLSGLSDPVCEASRKLAGMASPGNNMGGNSLINPYAETGETEEFVCPVPSELLPEKNWHLSSKNGKSCIIWLPQKNEAVSGRAAFIDAINFVLPASYYGERPEEGKKDEYRVRRFSEDCKRIFGFGVPGSDAGWRNFYKEHYVMPEGWGEVCINGQVDTMMVTIRGQGCSAAKPGWERRLFEFSKSVPGIHITRIDIAYDDFMGGYTVRGAYEEDWIAGKFNSPEGGRTPSRQNAGNWDWNDGKGITAYFGSRQNGKIARVYEKYNQLYKNLKRDGVAETYAHLKNWVRIEVEWHNKDRELPFDMLIESGKYLAGAYPAFNWINEEVQSRVRTFKNVCEVTFDGLLETAKVQFGALINVGFELLGADELVKRLIKEGVPKRLKLTDYELKNLPAEKIGKLGALLGLPVEIPT